MSAQRDDEAVRRYAEQFGNLLADTGWPRMAGRVFSAILASEEGRMTAAELSEQLQASPAAVSGAVNYLLQLRLATREREPGGRRDVYVVQDDSWYQTMMTENQALTRWSTSLRQVLEHAGDGTPAHHRVRITLGFFEFLTEEVKGLSDRWVVRRAELDAEIAAENK
ncbi:GbsR/MarR family transcriptional regulator [Kribbella sp. NPDC056345]|uniref:GbsR/MarR family transcriptional regulator n=1 Tax=Kribbella sp. NPDC056345 TaxID=3345789 RepID=UPI0035DFF4C4